jgi:hypothetical protein
VSVRKFKPVLPTREIYSCYGREVGRGREVEEELVRDARGEYFLKMETYRAEGHGKAEIRNSTRQLTLPAAVRYILMANSDRRFMREAEAMSLLPKAA